MDQLTSFIIIALGAFIGVAIRNSLKPKKDEYKQQANHYYREAITLYKAKQYKDALIQIQKSIEICPSEPVYQMEAAKIYTSLDDESHAIEYLIKAKALNHPDFYYVAKSKNFEKLKTSNSYNELVN